MNMAGWCQGKKRPLNMGKAVRGT